MGQKVKILVFLFLLICGLQSAERGRISRIQGEIRISRNTEILRPSLASRVYTNDLLLLDADAFVQIEAGRAQVQIKGPAKVTVTPRGRFEEEYGTLRWRRKSGEEKSLPLAIGYTIVFPGGGHYYIEDRFKAWPMFAGSAFLLWNILASDPTRSSQPDTVSQTRETHKQIYLVYLIVAVLDVWSETNNLNKDIRSTTEIMEDD
ncbi:MAG: hypothetical protein LBD99_06175 [Candidatus Margulisbacteria bacterium]|jgi:hypothetical protein|nr:hypothetical protein [Candidatus Margulisiibacteriota bacterium]